MCSESNELIMADIYAKLADAEDDVRTGKISDAADSLARLRAKYQECDAEL